MLDLRGAGKHTRIWPAPVRCGPPRDRTGQAGPPSVRVLPIRQLVRVLRHVHRRAFPERKDLSREALREVHGLYVFVQPTEAPADSFRAMRSIPLQYIQATSKSSSATACTHSARRCSRTRSSRSTTLRSVSSASLARMRPTSAPRATSASLRARSSRSTCRA